jgi:hypothetical protein
VDVAKKEQTRQIQRRKNTEKKKRAFNHTYMSFASKMEIKHQLNPTYKTDKLHNPSMQGDIT